MTAKAQDKILDEVNLLNSLPFVKLASTQGKLIKISYDDENFQLDFKAQNGKISIDKEKTKSEVVDNADVNRFAQRFINDFEWNDSVYIRDFIEKYISIKVDSIKT